MDLELLLQEVEKAKISGSPFVIYKNPEAKRIQGLFPFKKEISYLSDFSASGFVFAPFDNKNKTIIFSLHKCKQISVEAPKLSSAKKKFETKDLTDYQRKKDHLILVKKGIYFLTKNKFKKVVLSRKESFEIERFDLKFLFKNLLASYPNAFNYIWFHPEIGMWVGASPETLIKVNDKQFETMALAGTHIYKDDLDVVWDKKEKLEQKYVTDFIVSQLSDFDIQVSDPFSKKAGSLVHICTQITGDLKETKNLHVLIDHLHPTPAVCGVPKTDAKSFILNNEGYKREFYTGFLGEINTNNKTNLYVNLRCMQINSISQTRSEKTNVDLYIGGGITIDSDPEKEWEETVAKTKVMKKVLSN